MNRFYGIKTSKTTNEHLLSGLVIGLYVFEKVCSKLFVKGGIANDRTAN